MSWLSNFFVRSHNEAIVLIDVGAGSVAGGYAHFQDGMSPSIEYAKRVPIEPRESESRDKAMERALAELGEALVREGAPALVRATGRGSADAILVSISAPWQSTTLRQEKFEHTKPFTFTRSMLRKAVENAGVVPEGKMLVDESVVGTLLNGYETHAPYGRKVVRAEVVILASLIEESVARRIAGSLKALFHSERILSIAGSSLRYQTLLSLFPHERDAFILDATGPEIAIALVRKGLLVAVTELPDGEAGSPEWIKETKDAFADIAKRYPLPHSIFLLADKGKADTLKKTLDSAELDRLWLSDEPPKVLTIVPSHLSMIKNAATSEPDLAILLMALYWQKHGHDE